MTDFDPDDEFVVGEHPLDREGLREYNRRHNRARRRAVRRLIEAHPTEYQQLLDVACLEVGLITRRVRGQVGPDF